MATDKGLEDVPEGKNSFPRVCPAATGRPTSSTSSASATPRQTAVQSLRPQTFLRPRGTPGPRGTAPHRTHHRDCQDKTANMRQRTQVRSSPTMTRPSTLSMRWHSSLSCSEVRNLRHRLPPQRTAWANVGIKASTLTVSSAPLPSSSAPSCLSSRVRGTSLLFSADNPANYWQPRPRRYRSGPVWYRQDRHLLHLGPPEDRPQPEAVPGPDSRSYPRAGSADPEGRRRYR